MPDPRTGVGRTHPAATAWAASRRAGGTPSNVQSLGRTPPDWRHHNSAAFRLHDARGPGIPVVAKWNQSAAGELERLLYERILPTLPVPAIQLHGILREEDGTVWIFLQDVGDDEPSGESFVRLRTRWLASLHDADLDRWEPSLPPGGPSRYRNHLEAARSRLEKGGQNPVMKATHHDLLARVLKALDRVEARWSLLEEFSARLPRTLVHGDLQAKNLRRVAELPDLPYVLDWDTVGFGSPAADLASSCTDLGLYIDLRSNLPSHVTVQDIRRASVTGEVFRLLAAIDWAGHWLPLPHPERALGHLRSYLDSLIAAQAALDS